MPTFDVNENEEPGRDGYQVVLLYPLTGQIKNGHIHMGGVSWIAFAEFLVI